PERLGGMAQRRATTHQIEAAAAACRTAIACAQCKQQGRKGFREIRDLGGAAHEVSDEAAIGGGERLDTSLAAGLPPLLPAQEYAVEGCHSYCFMQSATFAAPLHS